MDENEFVKALRRAYMLGQRYWQLADSESYSQNKKAVVPQGELETLVAQFEDLPCGMPPYQAIGSLLNQAMEQAVANGADSRSMPDDYVSIAAWLCNAKGGYPND